MLLLPAPVISASLPLELGFQQGTMGDKFIVKSWTLSFIIVRLIYKPYMTKRTKTVIAVNVINHSSDEQATGSGPSSTALVMGQNLVSGMQLMNVINGRRV